MSTDQNTLEAIVSGSTIDHQWSKEVPGKSPKLLGALITSSFSDPSEIPNLTSLIVNSIFTPIPPISSEDLTRFFSNAPLWSPLRHAFEEHDVSYRDISDESDLKRELDAITMRNKPPFRSSLLSLIDSTHFEYGFTSEVDEFLLSAFNEFGSLAREWMEDIFHEILDHPSVACGLLRTLAHFKYSDIRPQGVSMAVIAFSHDDVEVRECGIRCFENWGDPSALSILKSARIEERWLADYLTKVISYLEIIEKNRRMPISFPNLQSAELAAHTE